MKKIAVFIFAWILNLISIQTFAQVKQASDSLGLPGDNLNLYAVMKLFQESETLEGFEKNLNAESSKINNLDLNGDNKIDYIRVVDNVDGKVHNIVLQVPMSEKENQDVAVFIVERNSKDEVVIQLIGDEDLYGKDYIVEPNYSKSVDNNETPNPGYTKTSSSTTVDENGNTTIINNYTAYETASWPVVQYMYTPSYVVWVSPWHYWFYPPYWNPWTPWFYHHYYGYHSHWHHHYYGHYHHSHFYRSPIARNAYYGQRRSVSPIYVSRRQSGEFKGTYSKPESRKLGSETYKKDVAAGKTKPANIKSDNKPRNSTNTSVNNSPREKNTGNKPYTTKSSPNKPRNNNSGPSVKPSKPSSAPKTVPRSSQGPKGGGSKGGTSKKGGR